MESINILWNVSQTEAHFAINEEPNIDLKHYWYKYYNTYSQTETHFAIDDEEPNIDLQHYWYKYLHTQYRFATHIYIF